MALLTACDTPAWLASRVAQLREAITAGNGRACTHLMAGPRPIVHALWQMRADTAQRIGEYLRPPVADDAQDEPEDDPEEGADDRDSGNN